MSLASVFVNSCTTPVAEEPIGECVKVVLNQNRLHYKHQESTLEFRYEISNIFFPFSELGT